MQPNMQLNKSSRLHYSVFSVPRWQQTSDKTSGNFYSMIKGEYNVRLMLSHFDFVLFFFNCRFYLNIHCDGCG